MIFIVVRRMAEADTTMLGERGRVVIPKRVRDRLKLTPKTKLLVYLYRDTVMLKKLELPDVVEELESLWKEIDKTSAGEAETNRGDSRRDTQAQG